MLRIPVSMSALLAALLVGAAGADAQRVNNRVGGAAAPDAPRPYSAPLNPTATRQMAIGAVPPPGGPGGQMAADAEPVASVPNAARRTAAPQVMAALAPAAPVPTLPAVRAAAPAVRAAGTSVGPADGAAAPSAGRKAVPGKRARPAGR